MTTRRDTPARRAVTKARGRSCPHRFAATLRVGLVLLGILGATAVALAQFSLPSLPGGIRVPVPPLPSLGGDNPTISTSFADAVTEIPFLDGYEPADPRPMALLPRASDGSIRVQPGAWQMDAMSYCLHAGTHGPGKGEGYLYAPLAGPRGAVIRKVLQRSVAHTEIPQERIQVLIWAILARTRINQANAEIQDTAARLLDPSDIASLSGGGLDPFSNEIMRRALGAAPPLVRQVLDAENTLRGMMARAVPYDQLAAVAVRSGDPPESNARKVPRGRWSYNPQGYLVRYVPNTYRETRVTLYRPQPIRLSRDAEGRITDIADTEGNRIQVEYTGSAVRADVGGQAALDACAFRTVRFTHTFLMRPERAHRVTATWRDRGWTLAPLRGGASSSSGRSAPADMASRRAEASTFEREIAGYDRMRSRLKRPGAASLDDVRALGHLVMALQATLDGEGVPATDWRRRHVDLAWGAWMNATIAYLGPSRVADRHELASLDLLGLGGLAADTSAGGAPSFDASGDVATPADTGRQRLSQSDRPRRPDKDACALAQKDLDEARKYRNAFADQSILDRARENNWDSSQYDQAVKDSIFGHSDAPAQEGTDYQVPMATDPNNHCTIKENWSRQRYRDEGYSDVNYEADRAHEQVHQDHCRREGGGKYNADMSFPNKLSADEVAAYDAKIKYLEKWIAENCR